MSRKVYLDAEIEVLVPVRLKGEFILRADEDANIHQALKRWAQHRPYSKADVEDHDFAITKIGGKPVGNTDLGDLIDQATTNIMENGKVVIIQATITDSK